MIANTKIGRILIMKVTMILIVDMTYRLQNNRMKTRSQLSRKATIKENGKHLLPSSLKLSALLYMFYSS